MSNTPDHTPSDNTPSHQQAIASQLEKLVQAYQRAFGQRPTWAAVAPGRVNLIGEHTDYNDGFVLPMAIQRQTVIVAGPSATPNIITLASTAQTQTAAFTINDGKLLMPGEPFWANYVKGVVAGWLSREHAFDGSHALSQWQKAGRTLPGFNAMIDTTVPLGGGLSSSASLEVATATLLEQICRITIPGEVKALLCQKAEHDFADTPCGIMDQFISTMAQRDHAMLLDCRTHETRMVPMVDPAISVLIINSNVKHELSGGEYAQRRQQCHQAASVLCSQADQSHQVRMLRDADLSMLLDARDKMDDVTFRRARHVITEIQRTLHAAEAATKNDWHTLGRLMYQSHDSLRDDFEVSCRELDILVDLASQIGTAGGVLGSRMTGGGFGGCTVSLVRTDRAHDISHAITHTYRQQTGIDAAAFVTAAAQGAGPLALTPVLKHNP